MAGDVWIFVRNGRIEASVGIDRDQAEGYSRSLNLEPIFLQLGLTPGARHERYPPENYLELVASEIRRLEGQVVWRLDREGRARCSYVF